MKILYLFISILFFLSFISCVSTTNTVSNIDCGTVLINGPSTLSVGETAVLNAVFYDNENKIIKNCKNISPVWNVKERDVIIIEKDMGLCIKIKAMKTGQCCVQANVNNIITSMNIEVK